MAAGTGMSAVVAAAAQLHSSRVAAASDVAAKQAAAARRTKRDKGKPQQVGQPIHTLCAFSVVTPPA